MRAPSVMAAIYASGAAMHVGFAAQAAANMEAGWLAWDAGIVVLSALMAWREW